jgi:hypothetical protein
MSSDRLSFNQNAQEPDDDARWEAYLALQRRTQLPPDPEAEIEPGADSEPRFGGASESSPADEVDFLGQAEGDQSDTSDAAVAFEADDDARIGPLFAQPTASLVQPPTPFVQPAPPPARRNARLVGATAALTAGIILAAALVQRQPDQPSADVRQPPAALPAAQAVAAPPVLRPREEQAAPSAAVPAPHPARPPHRLQTARLEKTGPRDCRGCRADHVSRPVHREPQCWIADANADGGVRLADCPRPASMMDGPG